MCLVDTVSVVEVVVCRCGDLVGWSGCSWEQAEDYVMWSHDHRMMHDVPDNVVFSTGRNCGSCRGDYDAKGA